MNDLDFIQHQHHSMVSPATKTGGRNIFVFIDFGRWLTFVLIVQKYEEEQQKSFSLSYIMGFIYTTALH